MGLIGENGAGKSTTIKLILDILHKDSGSVTVLGRDNEKLTKEDIGVVMDEAGIPECITPAQLGKVMANIFKNWDAAEYARLVKSFDLPENKAYKDFSRGMKMKLSIAVAMSHNAKLLLLDEPTSGLDPVVRDEVVSLFYDFTRDEEHSILISSHIVSDLEKICDYITFLHKGKVLLCEEKDLLKEQYGIIHCSSDELDKIATSAIKGMKKTAYGIDVIAEKSKIPSGMNIGSVDIEQLFIFMVKEAQ